MTLIALAVLLGVGAVALGSWTFVRQHRTSEPVAKPPADEAAPLRRAVSLLASSQNLRLPFAHSVGRLALVVDEQGHALLVVGKLGHAPPGLAYQAWTIQPGESPVPAARFAGGQKVVWLRGRVRHGARVAVTLERAAGVAAPTRPLRLVARRP